RRRCGGGSALRRAELRSVPTTASGVCAHRRRAWSAPRATSTSVEAAAARRSRSSRRWGSSVASRGSGWLSTEPPDGPGIDPSTFADRKGREKARFKICGKLRSSGGTRVRGWIRVLARRAEGADGGDTPGELETAARFPASGGGPGPLYKEVRDAFVESRVRHDCAPDGCSCGA